MKLKYKRILPGLIRPIIRIGVSNKVAYVQYEVLVDSGADNCIFDSQIGEILGIDILKGRLDKVTGITGNPEPCYFHPVTISIGGFSYNIEAGFMRNLRWPYGILGQKGFFNLFKIEFDYRKEKIELGN